MKNKISIKKCIFILSLLLAVPVTVLRLGRPFVSPFPMSAKLSDPTSAYTSEDGRMAIVDNAGHSILLLNSDKKIASQIILDENSLIDTAKQITGDENYWYVYGEKHARNSITVSSEKIVRYDRNGNHPESIYESKIAEDVIYSPFSSIISFGDDIIASVLYIPNDTWNVYEDYDFRACRISKSGPSDQLKEPIATDSTNELYISYYSPKQNAFYETDWMGHAAIVRNGEKEIIYNNPERVINYLFPAGDRHLLACDVLNLEILLDDTVIARDASVFNFSENENTVTFCLDNRDEILTFDINTGKMETYQQFDYSPTYGISLVISLILPLYLAIVLLIFFIRAIRKMSEASRRRVVLVLGAVGLIGIIIIFYSVRANNNTIADDKIHVRSQCNFLVSTYTDNPQLIIDMSSSDAIEQYDATDKYIRSFNSTNANTYVDSIVFLSQKIGDSYYRLYDSLYFSQIGRKVDGTFLEKLADSEEAIIVHDNGIDTIRCAGRIYDNAGNELGILEVGHYLDTLKSNTLERSIRTALDIISLIGAIYLIFTEVMAFIRGLSQKGEASLRHEEHTELYNLRSIGFLTRLVIAFDSVLLVLITQDMLSAGTYPDGSIAILTALPTTLMGIGLTLGSILYTWLAGRVTVKKLCVFGSIFMTLSYVAITYSVITNNYILFCIFKFTGSVSNNIIYGVISSMPNQTDDETKRYTAFQELGLGGLSSGILGALLGGFLADRIGNASLYALSVILLIIVGIFLFVVLPKNTYYVSSKAREKRSLKPYIRLFFSPTMIAFLLFLEIPFQTIYGYKNFLFPIYSSALSMPKIYVSSFVVIAKLITILISDGVRKISIRFDYWKVVVVGMASLGVFFLGFSLNSTIVWAVAMLLIASIMDKAMSPAKSMLMPRVAKDRGLDVAESGNILYIIEQFASSTKEIILSFFLLFGNSMACTVVGIFYIISIFLFALITRKSAMARKDGPKSGN